MELLRKDGLISAYGYACGYVNKVSIGQQYKELYKDGNLYHVRYRTDTGKGWKSFENLVNAETFFKSIDINFNKN